MASQANRKPLRAVWSLWTKPLTHSPHPGWLTQKHHLLSWLLSFESARRFYPETQLITDDAGARLLVDELGLSFEHVSTALNSLAAHDPDWWALGKLYAYHEQTEPFVHIDADVFLWKPLPDRLAEAGVFAQNPEPFLPGASHYRPESIEHALTLHTHGWLPEEWVWFRRARHDRQRGECCGIFGGTRTDFIRHYSGLGLRLANDPANRRGWALVTNKVDSMLLLEQYMLAACIEYHAATPTSPFTDVRLAYLFNSFTEAFNPDCAARVGYTHLIGDAKRNAAIADRLESRVWRDYPAQYEHCLAILQSS
jgi:hypothetical protein